MPEPITLILLGGALVAMLGGKKGPPGGNLPGPDTKDLVAVTEWKPTAQGLARYYRKEFIPSIATNLQPCVGVIAADGVYKGSRVIVYRIYESVSQVPAGKASYPIIDLCKIANNAKAAVLISTNYWIRNGGSFYMAIVPYAQRAEWSNLGRQWAVEFDDQAGEDSVPPVTKTPGRKVPVGPKGADTTAGQFDGNMTEEEKTAAAELIGRSDLDPAFYEAQALAAETDGHAGTTHGKHPKCAAMLRARGKELSSKQPPGGSPPGGKDEPPPPKEKPPAEDEYEVAPVARHQIQQTGSADFSSGFQTPQEIAASYGVAESRWVEILPINPLLKKSPVSPGVAPWPTASGFIWVPSEWYYPGQIPVATKLPAGYDPGAAKEPPAGEGSGDTDVAPLPKGTTLSSAAKLGIL
jgi:hypothetical protein